MLTHFRERGLHRFDLGLVRLRLSRIRLTIFDLRPPVVLTAIIVPSVLMPTGETINLKLSNPYLIGALTACVVGGLFKNLLLTIVVSMVVFLGFQWAFAMG